MWDTDVWGQDKLIVRINSIRLVTSPEQGGSRIDQGFR